MTELFNIWDNFFKSIDKIKTGIEPLVKRSGLSVENALILIIINDYPNLTQTVNNFLDNQLFDKGLIEYTDDGLCVTGKGAILAKSLSIVIKKL